VSEESKAAVEAVREQFPILFNEGKFDELGRFYAEDAIALPAGREPIEGRAAICQYFSKLYDSAGLRFDLGIIQTQAGTEMGYLVGTYVAHTDGNPSVPGVTHEACRLQRHLEVHGGHVAQLGGVSG
jgi:ketosteroid isomerase-like protein